MERVLLPAWLPTQRWFRSKSRAIASVSIEASARLGDHGADPLFAVARATFEDGSFERYALPLVLKSPEDAAALPEGDRIGEVRTENGTSVWCDASREPAFHRALYRLLSGETESKLGGGVLRGAPISKALAGGSEPAARLLSVEQSNTSFAYSSGYFAKLYRRLEAAVNPEPETLRFLRDAGYAHVPAFASGLEWRAEGRDPVTVALLQDWVASRGDAWGYALEQLEAARDSAELPGAFLLWSAALGRRVAELHNALASAPAGAFVPEPLLPEDLARMRSATREGLSRALATLAAALPRLDAGTAARAREVLALREALEARLHGSAEEVGDAVKIRTHGDLHLGQVLVAADDPEEIWILDFEGEPGRPLAEARRKHSPLRDAAGMMRSFHYAAHAALREPGLKPRAEAFAEALRRAFQDAYFAALRVPVSSRPQTLLDGFMLEKAVYELNYELDNRPDWAGIPLQGLKQLVTEY